MTESFPELTPGDILRSELERIGWTVEASPDDVTWHQADLLARSILRAYTRHHSPAVAALIEGGDFNAAAAAFMANVRTASGTSSR